MTFIRRLAAVLCGSLLIVHPIALAGFKYPAGDPNPPFDGYPIGDGTNTPANQMKIKPTKDKLGEVINQERAAMGMPPLMGDALTTAACARFDAIRANVKKVVELVVCEMTKQSGADKGKCADELCKKGAICIDFGNGAQGAQFCDESSDCKNDKINIGVGKFGTTMLPCYDPTIYSAFHTLLEEACHATQDFTATPGADACQTKAKKQLKAVCNEKDVDDKSIDMGGKIYDALCKLLNGQPHGLTDGAGKKLLDALAALPDGQAKKDAINALKKKVEERKKFDEDTRACYQAAKDALNDFLNGTITKDELNKRLGMIKWQIAGQTKPLTQPTTETSYRANSTTGVITQEQDGVEYKLSTGLVGVCDIELIEEGEVMLISGVTTQGTGSVLAAYDVDHDQLFATADIQTIVPATSKLRFNLDLFQPTSGGRFFVYDSASFLIYELLDTDLDGVPNQLGPAINSVTTGLDLVRHFKMTDGGRLLGFDSSDVDGNYAPNLDVTELVDANGDGVYETLWVHSTFGDVAHAPAQVDDPVVGATSITVMAMPTASLAVFLLNAAGDLGGVLATATASIGGGATTIPLLAPLTLQDSLVVADVTHGLLSNVIHVKDTCSIDSYGDPCNPNGPTAPVLAATGCDMMHVAVTKGAPNGMAVFAVGLQATAVPIGYGCDLLVDPLLLVTPAMPLDASGSLVLDVPMIVATPFQMTVQAVVFDGTSPKLATTNAIGYSR